MVKNGALRLFRLGGVDVYFHWSWLLIIYFLSSGMSQFSPIWLAADIAGYILLVALHETVQLVAGRMVGGHVTEMNISFLNRSSNLELPQRPWPIIITYSAGILAYMMTLGGTVSFFYLAAVHGTWGKEAATLSIYLLFFNVLLFVWAAAPVYPLDGGKILHGLLWLFMSRKRSLQAACLIGVPVSLGMIALSIFLAVKYNFSYISVLWTVLIFFQCLNGFKQAKIFDMIDKLPRRTDVTCPHCKQHPFTFTAVKCNCGRDLDPFQTRGLCKDCGSSIAQISCPICSQRSPIHAWFGPTGLYEVQNISPVVVEPILEEGPPALPPPPA